MQIPQRDGYVVYTNIFLTIVHVTLIKNRPRGPSELNYVSILIISNVYTSIEKERELVCSMVFDDQSACIKIRVGVELCDCIVRTYYYERNFETVLNVRTMFECTVRTRFAFVQLLCIRSYRYTYTSYRRPII